MSLIDNKLHEIKICGKKFNELYGNGKFYVFLNNNFTCESNLNVDPNKEYLFYEESKCHLHFDQYGHKKIASVKIPNDAQVCVELNEFKTNKIILYDILNFEDVDDEFWIKLLQYYDLGIALKYIKNQTYELCISAVKQHGGMLKYVNNKFLTEEICKFAIQQCRCALNYVTTDIKSTIYEFHKITPIENIYEYAVRHDGWSLQYVKKEFITTEKLFELCVLAVSQNGFVLQYVRNTYPNMLTEDLCISAVKQNGFALQYVKKELKTEKICALAVQQNGLVLSIIKIKTQTPLICKLAVQQNSFALNYVRHKLKQIKYVD